MLIKRPLAQSVYIEKQLDKTFEEKEIIL